MKEYFLSLNLSEEGLLEKIEIMNREGYFKLNDLIIAPPSTKDYLELFGFHMNEIKIIISSLKNIKKSDNNVKIDTSTMKNFLSSLNIFEENVEELLKREGYETVEDLCLLLEPDVESLKKLGISTKIVNQFYLNKISQHLEFNWKSNNGDKHILSII